MKALWNFVQFAIQSGRFKRAVLLCGVTLCIGLPSSFAGPLAAKVKVTRCRVSGSPLPKPDKILIYDLVADSSDVQVDASQKIRPRHIIAGDEKPEAILTRLKPYFPLSCRRSWKKPACR